jgi:hypothetical protein
MRKADDHSTLLEEQARKRESIGLTPHRPTAKRVVYSPPEAKRTIPLLPLLLLAAVIIATALVVWRASPFGAGSFYPRVFTPPSNERLIARDDFAEPNFALPVRSNLESDLSYVGDLYQILIERPGGLAWAMLGQPNLGAYRLEADLRLAAQQDYAWGYGGLVVRFQNDDNFYLFAVDSGGNYQIQLRQGGAWRTVQPWTPTQALSESRQKLLSVMDDGAALQFVINSTLVDTVPDPQLPVGDVGLFVGARSQGRAKGLFDWLALYEIPLAK